jgi:hypothetical protein
VSKIFRLREWVTPREAAEYLSISLREKVTEADVYRLALDHHLTISVDFVNHATAHIGRPVSTSEAGEIESPFPSDKGVKVPLGIPLADGTVLLFDEEVRTVDGVWDLPMLGAERIDLERRFQQLTGGPDVELIALDGTFVTSYNRKVWCQLQEQGDYDDFGFEEKYREKYKGKFWFPANGLPEDAALVVRTEALAEFESKLGSTERKSAQPLSTKERVTALVVIASLAKAAEIDLSQPTKAAGVIEKLTQTLGSPVSKRTLVELIKAIPDAVERRSRG